MARALEDLAETLWAERRVADFLLYKLVVAKLVLAADERRCVTQALDEVERAVALLQATEVKRASVVAALACTWDAAPEDCTLATLARRAPAPLGSVLRDHQQALADLADQIQATAAASRELVASALASAQDTLDALTGPRRWRCPADQAPPVPAQWPGPAWLHAGTGDLLLDLAAPGNAAERSDTVRTVMELEAQELACEAALATLPRALPPSLTAFLR